MDKNILGLRGSPFRDKFKSLHKTELGNGYYATDIDLALVSFRTKSIIAILDCKNGENDTITSTERIAYDDLSQHYPIFIIRAVDSTSLDRGSFSIYRYRENGEQDYITEIDNWEDFKVWEDELRHSLLNRPT